MSDQARLQPVFYPIKELIYDEKTSSFTHCHVFASVKIMPRVNLLEIHVSTSQKYMCQPLRNTRVDLILKHVSTSYSNTCQPYFRTRAVLIVTHV